MYTRPRIIPVLLVEDGDLVKTVRFGERTYLGDPVNAVKIFNRKYVDELSFLDISATVEGRGPNFELLRDIASEAFMPLSYGGGLANLDQIGEVLSIGYEKAVVNTALVEHPEVVEEAAAKFGSQSMVASIDAVLTPSGYKCAIHAGKQTVDVSPSEFARRAVDLGVGEIIVNSIDRDGMMGGYDIELVRSVTDAVRVPVVALGGAGCVGDMKMALEKGGAHAVAGGSMFVYDGKLKAVLITAPSEKELIDASVYTS